MPRKRILSFDQELAKQANYSPVFSDKSSPAGNTMYKKQKSDSGKKIKASRSNNPNYIASKAFGQGEVVKQRKIKAIGDKRVGIKKR